MSKVLVVSILPHTQRDSSTVISFPFNRIPDIVAAVVVITEGAEEGITGVLIPVVDIVVDIVDEINSANFRTIIITIIITTKITTIITLILTNHEVEIAVVTVVVVEVVTVDVVLIEVAVVGVLTRVRLSVIFATKKAIMPPNVGNVSNKIMATIHLIRVWGNLSALIVVVMVIWHQIARAVETRTKSVEWHAFITHARRP